MDMDVINSVLDIINSLLFSTNYLRFVNSHSIGWRYFGRSSNMVKVRLPRSSSPKYAKTFELFVFTFFGCLSYFLMGLSSLFMLIFFPPWLVSTATSHHFPECEMFIARVSVDVRSRETQRRQYKVCIYARVLTRCVVSLGWKLFLWLCMHKTVGCNEWIARCQIRTPGIASSAAT